MAPTSPDKPDARRSRSRPPLYSFSGSMRHQLPVIPRPSQRHSTRRLPQTEALAESPPTGRLDRSPQLRRSSRPIRKTARSIVPRSQRSNATIMAGIRRSLRSHPGIFDQSREPPVPVDSKHPQSPCTPLSSIPSKRPHAVDANGDSRCSHGSPLKRRCLTHQGLSELSHTPTTAADLLPQFPFVDDVVTRPSGDRLEDEFPKEDQRHSSCSLASMESDTAISPRKQKHGTTERRSASARATDEHNQLDPPTRSIEHQAKPFSKRPGDGRLPSEKCDTKVCQKPESPQHTVVGNTEGGPYGSLPGPDTLSEPTKPSRNKSGISRSPRPTTSSVLKGWPLFFVCLVALIGGMLLPEFRVPEFRAVDWNERAIELEIALATISRVVLLGEANVSQQRLQPGMLPADGLVHDHNPLFGLDEDIPVGSKWFSNSTEFPQYEHWLTTSSGAYVPDLPFLHDIWKVIIPVCLVVDPASPPDPDLHPDDFYFLLTGALIKFKRLYRSEYHKLTFYYNSISVSINEAMLSDMAFLQQMQRNGSEKLGSDRLRARAFHAPTTTTVSLSTTEPPPPSRLPVDTGIPDDIPESFIKGWHDAMAARSSRLEQEHTSTSTPTIETPVSMIPWPSEYAEAQLNNGTAKLLVEYVLDMIVGRYLNQTDEGWLPTYGNIIKHSTNLDKFYDLFLQLNDKVSHFLRSTNSTELSGAKSIKFQLVQDAAPFLRDIAAPRLAGMQARAKRGAQLLKETQKRQAELQNEIARTVRNGWVAPGAKWLSHRVIYYYLPDLKSMALQWSYARQWLTVELEEIFEVCQGREAEFKSHDKEPPSNLSRDQVHEWWWRKSKLIVSRWSMEDRREDPLGKEAFCFEDSHKLEDSTSIWERMATWVMGLDKNEFSFFCGDASKRHG